MNYDDREPERNPPSDRGDTVGAKRRRPFRIDAGPHGLFALASRIYEFCAEAGWHDPPPAMGEIVANFHTEVSEFWEAWRLGKIGRTCEEERARSLGDRSLREADMCDKADKMVALGLDPLTCAEEELADIIIRALETSCAMGVDIDRAIEIKMAYNASRGRRWEGKRV